MPGIPQFDDVSHSQSTMFESGKSELQDKHNMNESGTDQDILRSPSGSSHQAGCEPTACREGIECTRENCKFAHPSKALKCKGGQVLIVV